MQRFIMPTEEEKIMSFSNYKNMLPASFVIYSDVESICEEKEVVNKGKTISKSKHTPISVCAYAICRDNPDYTSEKPFLYTGKDCIEQLFNFIFSYQRKVAYILKYKTYSIDMTTEAKERHRNALVCNFCKKHFTKTFKKYRDHNHLLKYDNYRQTLCNICNLDFAAQKDDIYIFFHGLSNYDSHFLVQYLNQINDHYIKVIPKNSERYLSFSVGNIHFKDSASFLPASLAELVKSLKDKGESCFENVNKIITNKKLKKYI